MHLSLRTLLGGTVRIERDDLSVSDAWIDADAMVMRYVGLDVGGWLATHVALVSADRLAWSDGWRADVTRAEIESDDARLEDGRGLIDIAALPPVITGPFGFSVSPMLIGAGLMAEAQDGAPPSDPSRAATADLQDETRALDRGADWIGATVTVDGDAGALAVADLLIDPADMRITHMVVEAAGLPRAVPVERIARRTDRNGPVVLTMTLAEVEAAPEMVSPRQAAGRGAS